jgi:CRP/FNR family cyclic AMP-dependent transcriptional regulator
MDTIEAQCHNQHMLATTAQQEALSNFFQAGTRQTYSKGDRLVPPIGVFAGLHYIESGLVKSYDITKYGEQNLLIIRKAGEILGLTHAITETHIDVTNEALAPTVAWFVSNQSFLTFLTKHPEAVLPILETATQMYRLHSERIMTLEYRTVRERLASFLLTTAERFGVRNDGQITVELPLTQQDIASSISATRETTSRTLMQFSQKGLIHMSTARIVLIDPVKLQEIIE